MYNMIIVCCTRDCVHTNRLEHQCTKYARATQRQQDILVFPSKIRTFCGEKNSVKKSFDHSELVVRVDVIFTPTLKRKYTIFIDIVCPKR